MNQAGPRAAACRRGITLLELMVTLALAGLVLAISFPSFMGGLDGVRVQATARRVGAFINAAHARVEREQEPVEILVDLKNNRLSALSARGDWQRDLALEAGVQLTGVLPAPPAGAPPAGVPPDEPLRFVILPGVPGPRLQVQLTGRVGHTATIEMDPISGVPEILDERK
jgi:prepilin-type N-terminal cleavage/methylation domain-containing protein